MKSITLLPVLIILPFFGLTQNLKIFYLNHIEVDSLSKFGFVSLTDEENWNWTVDPDGIIERYSYNKLVKGDYHELTLTDRTTFLNSVKIEESYNIYLYNMLIDSVFIFKVNETRLVAKPDIYGMSIQVGFKLKSVNIDIMENWNTFIYIGNHNPFQTGKAQPIVWREVESTVFPSNIQSINHTEWFNQYSREKVFKFENDSLTYLIQNLGSGQGHLEARHLIVTEKKTNKILFNYIFDNSESTSNSPLIDENKSTIWQWTGEIFKDKPPIVYGFEWVSFGCPRIDFIGHKEPSIYIYCDNRH